MNTHKPTFIKAVLARIIRGAVPVDGPWWFDPKEAAAPKSSKTAQLPDPQWSPVSLPLSRPLRRS